MSTVQEIESAIEQLAPSQRWDLFRRLQDLLWEDWDRQIEADYAAGRLDSLISEVESDISARRLMSLPNIV